MTLTLILGVRMLLRQHQLLQPVAINDLRPNHQPSTSQSLTNHTSTSHPNPHKMASQQPSQDPTAPVDASQNPQQPTEEETGYAPLVDPRLPTRKDTSLREFLSKIDDYAPIVRFPCLFPLFLPSCPFALLPFTRSSLTKGFL